MRFADANLVEMTVWWMRYDDWKPGKNRALIDRVFNGAPPWPENEVDQQNVRSNINDLSGPRYIADARRSLQRAMETSDRYFKVDVDCGPAHKAAQYSSEITRLLSRPMKRSRTYWETLDSQLALKCVHGIGPVHWIDRDHWTPKALAIQDLLIPSRTLRSMENLDHFAVFRQLTHEQLYKLTHRQNRDPQWQMDVVNSALQWVYEQTIKQVPSWAESYAPQTLAELEKENQGYFGTSAVPTVDVWDFYFHEDVKGKEGWRRGMILDTPCKAGDGVMPSKNRYDMDHGKWLYRPSEKRVYAQKLDELIHFQFGDATCSAPFTYKGVRSLGWLLYPFCHLQNRMYSRFFDHVFESLLNYIRANRREDYEEFVKLELHDLGLVPPGIQFLPQEQRWQINQPLMELAFTQNRGHMDEAAALYREGRETQRPTERETATAVIARVNAAAALVGSLITNTYREAGFQFREIGRRFCRKNSIDSDVRRFRADALAAGVPEEAFDVERWEITPDKILGNGNKMMAMAMVQELMATYHLHDPEAQREILEIHDREVTDNPELGKRLAGMGREEVTPSVRIAQNMVGTLMAGVPVLPQRGENPDEIIRTLLFSMATIVTRLSQTGPMAHELVGLQTLGATIAQYIGLLSQQGREVGPKVKEYSADLKQLMSTVEEMGKAMAEQQQQAAQGGNGGMDPKDVARVQGMQMQAQVKADNTAKSHASRTAQKQVQFEQKLQQDSQRHQFELQKDMEKHRMEMTKEAQALQGETAALDLKTAAEIRRENAKPKTETVEE